MSHQISGNRSAEASSSREACVFGILLANAVCFVLPSIAVNWFMRDSFSVADGRISGRVARDPRSDRFSKNVCPRYVNRTPGSTTPMRRSHRPCRGRGLKPDKPRVKHFPAEFAADEARTRPRHIGLSGKGSFEALYGC